jgi:hypothetical protein
MAAQLAIRHPLNLATLDAFHAGAELSLPVAEGHHAPSVLPLSHLQALWWYYDPLLSGLETAIVVMLSGHTPTLDLVYRGQS